MIKRLFIALTLICAAPALAQTDLHGITPELQKNLRKKFPNLNGASLPELDQAIRFLFQTGEFDTVRILQKEGGGYTIAGVAIKKLTDIAINGNNIISDSDVQQILGIQTGDRFDKLKIEENAAKLKDRYSQLGYLGTSIEIGYQFPSENSAQVNITVVEGSVSKLTNIQIITNNEELKSELTRVVKSYLKKPFVQQQVLEIQQELQNYLSNNRYLISTLSNVEVTYNETRTEATLSVTVERPYKFILLFEGNQFYQSNELLREISVNSQNPTGSNPAAELADRVKALYISKGYSHIDINYTETLLNKSFGRRVVFKISEGPRVRVKKIELLGSLSQPHSFYLDFLKDNSSSSFTYGYYNRIDLEKGMENLVFELQNRGFLKARIKSSRVDYSKNKEWVTIQIFLDEGPLTRIASIDFKGNSRFTPEQLKEAIGMEQGQPLSLKQLEDSLRLLQEFYFSRGYLDMSINTPNSELVNYSEDNSKAQIKYEIYEGPEVKVANIAVEGNDTTATYVVLKELEFERGDLLTPEVINDSIYRLQRLGLFSEISIGTLEKGTPISDRTVVVRVSERNPGLFTSGVGVNTEFDLTARGYIGVGYRNLGGTARALTGRIEVKRVTDINFLDHKITTGYLEPYLLNSRTRGRVNLTRSYVIKNRIKGPVNQVIAAEGNELELLLEREFFRHLKVTWNFWSIAYEREFELNDKREETSQIIGTVGPTVELDYRDNPFNPTEGLFTRLNAEYSNPAFGNTRYIEYIKTNAVVNHYLRLGSPRWIWANSVRGGFIKNMDEHANSNRGVPESKLFFLGGRSTIRGFDPFQIPRRDALLNDSSQAYYLDTESHFYLLKSELRFPIYNDIGGVLFYDGGAVKVLGRNIEPAYREAVGVGMRYNTPVGPLSFEYGHKLNRLKKLGESEGRFHLSIGTF